MALIGLLATSLSAFAVDVELYFYADGKIIHTASASAGSAHTLSTYVNGDTVTACRGWEFAGWTLEAPAAGVTSTKPTLVTSVTPAANMNIYAVYRKENGTTTETVIKYSKVTTGSSPSNGIYLIVGKTGGNYYAMGNTTITSPYSVAGDVYYSVPIDEPLVFNGSGEVEGEQNAKYEWTWSSSTFRNRGNTSVYIHPYWSGTSGDYYNYVIGSSVSLTVARSGEKWAIYNTAYHDLVFQNSEFTYANEKDYVYYHFYLFKKGEEEVEVPAYDYTSYPDCSRWEVYFDAGLGTIGATSNHKDTIRETTHGAAIDLPTATEGDEYSCGGWDFFGWHRDTPVETTTSAPTVYTGSGYLISYDGEKMYAVYESSNDIYQRVTKKSDIKADDVCIIATTSGRAITTSYAGYKFEGTTGITISGTKITSVVSASAVEWTYDGSTYFKGSNGTYLTWSGGTSTYYYFVYNADGPEFQLKENSDSHYLGVSGDDFGEVSTPENFYIYKKVSKTYSSFPHCRPYTFTLHACGGTIDVNGDGDNTGDPQNYLMTEENEGEGRNLPNALPRCPENGWSFVGWVEGNALGSVRKTNFTNENGLVATSPYIPTHDGVHLYAVYARLSDYYRIVSYPDNMVAGDNYIITYYTEVEGDETENTWDVELSSETVSTNYLAGVPKDAPQDGEGYYMIATDSTVLWQLGGSTDAWTFKNLKNGKYLQASTSGYVKTNGSATSFKIRKPTSSNLNLQMYINGGSYNYYLVYYDGSKFTTMGYDNFSYTSGGKTYYYKEQIFLYRQMHEYASYPHCDAFTVNFDGCGGRAGYTSKTESAPYAGIDLPFAFANNDCSKEKWEFAGWAETPVTEETDVLSLDLLPPGVRYVPAKNNLTLYAVYCKKEDTYAKVTSSSNLYLGVNYVIATPGNKAMKNKTKDTNYISYESISPSDDVVTMTDHNMVWRLQGERGMYEIFNVDDSVYLDLRSAQIHLRDSAHDNFQIKGSSGNFRVRSNMSIVNNVGKKYLYFDTSNNRFTVESEDNVEYAYIYFYQQQALYNSYPYCVDPIEPLRWTADNHVVLESYVLSGKPTLSGGIGSAAFQSDEGTYCLEYNPAVLTPGSNAAVSWGDVHVSIHVPYVISSNTNAGSGDCLTCDYVVLPDATLTIDQNKAVHNITVYEGGTLHIANGKTLSVHALILRRDDDTKAPQVTFGNESSAIHLQFNEVYFDTRIDDSRYYWFTLPYNSFVKNISYSNEAANGKMATYRTDFYVRRYDGARRTDDANAGTQAKNYWTHVADAGANYTLQAGIGYQLGLADQAGIIQADGHPHAKRVMRFTMTPDDETWNTKERSNQKSARVAPSQAADPRNAPHAGWNLIGNPYLHNYTTGSTGSSGLVNGYWVEEVVDEEKTGYLIIDTEHEGEHPSTVPYLTIYNPGTKTYSQYRASSFRALKPFEAVFVQINEGPQIYFSETMNMSGAPAYRRVIQHEGPLNTGITLVCEDGKSDRTGIVLADEYTTSYEIGGDLVKMSNSKAINLYTLNADNQKLAFNALSDEDAINPIPVGVSFPNAGIYTFAFDAEQYSSNGLDTLMLIDKVAGVSTNLLYENYMFELDKAGTIDNRFEILVRRAKNQPLITTDLNNVFDAGKPRKVIRDGQLFIINDGKMYNAVGTEVK